MKLMTATALAALIAGPALAQDAAMTPQAELVGNMGNIEANIAEAQSRLMTHMLLPADDDRRDYFAARYADDVASVDTYLALVQTADLPEGAQQQITDFATEWSSVKQMGEALLPASRDELAAVDDVKTYAEAVIGLDDYIDEALEAAGLPDDDAADD